MTLTIVANIYSQEDKIEFVKQELIKLIEPTQSEKGCINYDLHQNNEDISHFMFYENWESYEDWQNHMKTSHIRYYVEAVKGAVKRQTFQMQKVEV